MPIQVFSFGDSSKLTKAVYAAEMGHFYTLHRTYVVFDQEQFRVIILNLFERCIKTIQEWFGKNYFQTYDVFKGKTISIIKTRAQLDALLSKTPPQKPIDQHSTQNPYVLSSSRSNDQPSATTPNTQTVGQEEISSFLSSLPSSFSSQKQENIVNNTSTTFHRDPAIPLYPTKLHNELSIHSLSQTTPTSVVNTSMTSSFHNILSQEFGHLNISNISGISAIHPIPSPASYKETSSVFSPFQTNQNNQPPLSTPSQLSGTNINPIFTNNSPLSASHSGTTPNAFVTTAITSVNQAMEEQSTSSQSHSHWPIIASSTSSSHTEKPAPSTPLASSQRPVYSNQVPISPISPLSTQHNNEIAALPLTQTPLKDHTQCSPDIHAQLSCIHIEEKLISHIETITKALLYTLPQSDVPIQVDTIQQEKALLQSLHYALLQGSIAAYHNVSTQTNPMQYYVYVERPPSLDERHITKERLLSVFEYLTEQQLTLPHMTQEEAPSLNNLMKEVIHSHVIKAWDRSKNQHILQTICTDKELDTLVQEKVIFGWTRPQGQPPHIFLAQDNISDTVRTRSTLEAERM